MKILVTALLGIIAVTLSGAKMTGTPVHSNEECEITVHLDQPGTRLSPNLYGVFFEEINHAGDGGLYAELIRNRSFEGVLKRHAPHGHFDLDSAPGSFLVP